MSNPSKNEVVHQHLLRFFDGHRCEDHVWTLGPAHEELPDLRVLELAPGPRSNLWIYATCGAWKAHADPQLEFVIAAPNQDLRHVELLFITAWYHGRHCLGTGHTMPIGEPWLPGSKCDCFLVSTPYPFGPDLEICNFAGSHVHVLWLLPITNAEREFKIEEGQEALEQRFEDCQLEYWDAGRESAV